MTDWPERDEDCCRLLPHLQLVTPGGISYRWHEDTCEGILDVPVIEEFMAESELGKGPRDLTDP